MWLCLFSFTLSARESYGEDIADTDSHRSDCSDEEYDDSFIDDEEPLVFPRSPVSSGGMVLYHLHRSWVFHFL